MVVTRSREQIHFAVELGLVDVVMRQQRLHQHQTLRLAASDAESFRQEHVAVEALSWSMVSINTNLTTGAQNAKLSLSVSYYLYLVLHQVWRQLQSIHRRGSWA